MRWFGSFQGQPFGPVEEQEIISMLQAGRLDHVQGEAGGPWLPVHHSPFAAYVVGVPRQSLHPLAGTRPDASAVHVPKSATKSESSASVAKWVFVGGVAVGVIVCGAVGWIGVLAGIALVAWTILRHRAGRRSLMAIAWARPRGTLTTAGTIGVGLLFSACGAKPVIAEWQAETRKKNIAAQHQAEKDAAAEAKARARAELEAALPRIMEGWRQRLSAAALAEKDSGPAEARAMTRVVEEDINTYNIKLGAPAIDVVVAEGRYAAAQYARFDSLVRVVDAAKIVESNIPTGKMRAAKREWLAADAQYDGALSALDRIDAAPPEAKAALPNGFDARSKRSEVKALQRAIATPVAHAKMRSEKEDAIQQRKRNDQSREAAAYASTCGERPRLGAWDGEVVGLERVLKQHAHDPNSIDVENCTEPVLTDRECWKFRCDVRGKNAFGAMVLTQPSYSYSSALGFQEL
jgi:hypothetical protein